MKYVIQILSIFFWISLSYSKRYFLLPFGSKTDATNSTWEKLKNFQYKHNVLFFNKYICPKFEPSSKITPSFLTADANKINLILLTNEQQSTVRLSDIKQIFNSELFKKQWPTVLYVSGYVVDYSLLPNLIKSSLADAYLKRNNVNFLILDPTHYELPLYTWAVYNAEIIANFVAKALTEVNDIYPVKNIHCIGISLGAHLVGGIGSRYHNITGEMISHITGLDPALPCFTRENTIHKLSKNDAEFVDVIHTNNGVLGIKDPIGHVDFYPNGPVEIQQGCTYGFVDLVCSHVRSLDLYAESVLMGHEKDFLSMKCDNFQELERNNCSGSPVYMGYLVPYDARGIYYLKTKRSYPFGENSK